MEAAVQVLRDEFGSQICSMDPKVFAATGDAKAGAYTRPILSST